MFFPRKETNTWIAAVIMCWAFLYKPHTPNQDYRKNNCKETTKNSIIILNLFEGKTQIYIGSWSKWSNTTSSGATTDLADSIGWAVLLCWWWPCIWLNMDEDPSTDAKTDLRDSSWCEPDFLIVPNCNLVLRTACWVFGVSYIGHITAQIVITLSCINFIAPTLRFWHWLIKFGLKNWHIAGFTGTQAWIQGEDDVEEAGWLARENPIHSEFMKIWYYAPSPGCQHRKEL